MPVLECPYEEGLKKFDDATDKAYGEVIRLGLGVSQRPFYGGKAADRPEIPHNLSELGLSELGNLLGVLTKWHSYAIGQKIIAGNERDAAAEKKTFAWKRIRRLKDGTVSDKDDATGIDVRYIEVEAHFRYADAKYSFLAGMVDALKRETETVSRAFEVLRQRIELEGRNVGMGRRVNHAVERVEHAKQHDSLSQMFRRRVR